MTTLKTIDKEILEKLFQMWGGYVLDFSDRTMSEFFQDNLWVNIYDEKYNYSSWSKANRVRGFWIECENKIVGDSILKLIEYIESKIAIEDFKEIDFPEKLREWSRKIWNRLLEKQSEELKINPEIDFSKEIGKYLKKAENEIEIGDYDWGIGTLSTFLEEVFEDLHIKITWDSIWESADLKRDFGKIKKLLNLSPDSYVDQKIKQILEWLSKIVDALDSLCNTLGDRHRKLKDIKWNIRVKPLKHHAMLVLNSTKILTKFLYDTFEYQRTKTKVFKLPNSANSIYKIIDITNKFTWEYTVKIWTKKFNLSIEWIMELEKLYKNQ